MRNRLPLAFLAFVACQPPGVAVPVERLDVPEKVEMLDVVAGASTQAPFQIGNSGAGSARVELRVGDPFYVTTPSVYVPAGGTATVRVGIRDPGYTTVVGTIEVVGPFDAASIPVSAVFDLDLDDDGFLAFEAGGSDCDDDDAGAFPTADEVCNHRDDDCDGQADEEALDRKTWFADRDGDGYGNPDDIVVSCDRPVGFVQFGGDCDDDAMSVHPGATEQFYDGVDQDCAGTSDFDRDGDGYDHVLFGGADCRDQDESVHPDAAETDDLVDQDCDSLVDEDFLVHGDLVITEILVAPAARTPEDGQYVEVTNPSAERTIQLRGMRVESDAGSVELGSAMLDPGEVGLLCANTKPAANGGLSCVGPLPGLLGQHDWVRVSSAAMLDQVDWTADEWKMLPGVALELGKVDADENDDFASWCSATATTSENTDSGSPGDAQPSCAPVATL